MRIFEYKYEDISEPVEKFCPHVIDVRSNMSPPTAERFESTPVEYLQSKGSEFATSVDCSASLRQYHIWRRARDCSFYLSRACQCAKSAIRITAVQGAQQRMVAARAGKYVD